MDSWLVFRRNRVILNQWTKRNDRSFEWFPKTSLVWSFPIRQEILNVSQISIAFHRICPPIFIQTWLQQCGRGAFLHSAHCSFSDPICFRSVWCRRTMIPGKIFTGFAKFQGIVSVIDFRLPFRLQELLQASLGFLWSFGFARIRLDPLGGQVLHHDCISTIVSRFTTFTENFVICYYQITNIFCARYGSANASSAQGLVILVLWQISQFRSLGKWVQTLCLPKSTPLVGVGSKDGSWEELACESLRSGTLSSARLSQFLQPHSGMSEHNRSPPFYRGFIFNWFLVFGWLG